jgi:hypothetical protein
VPKRHGSPSTRPAPPSYPTKCSLPARRLASAAGTPNGCCVSPPVLKLHLTGGPRCLEQRAHLHSHAYGVRPSTGPAELGANDATLGMTSNARAHHLLPAFLSDQQHVRSVLTCAAYFPRSTQSRRRRTTGPCHETHALSARAPDVFLTHLVLVFDDVWSGAGDRRVASNDRSLHLRSPGVFASFWYYGGLRRGYHGVESQPCWPDCTARSMSQLQSTPQSLRWAWHHCH